MEFSLGVDIRDRNKEMNYCYPEENVETHDIQGSMGISKQ